MNPLWYLAALAILTLVIFKTALKKVVIYEHERGLLYSGGKFLRVLEPGVHWLSSANTKVSRVDGRTRYETIAGQEVLSADQIGLKVSLAVKYEVSDPYLALNKVENFSSALYLETQVALREAVGSLPIDELLEGRTEIGARLMEIVQPKVEPIGLLLHSVEVKDVMFPGDLKKLFAQVVNARKEGQAALERARGETAALRSLANAARMVQDNPALLQLRLLQVVGEQSGNTVIIGNTGITPLPHPPSSSESDPS